MEKIKVAVVGYGNIGHFSVEAVLAAPDMELVGVVRRSVKDIPAELRDIKVVSNIDELGKVDVAILCGPSRSVPATALEMAKKGIRTVDSFDIHGQELLKHYKDLNAACQSNNTVSIISAGWDPGSDSVIRTMMMAMAPKGLTYTNFGPGMSMGHSVVARSKKGVKNALSMTIPLGTSIHRRMVYVELEDGAKLEDVAAEIKADSYFAHDETHVIAVPSVDALQDMGHGVLIERKGVSGKTQSQRIEFRMTINNPALTAQILCSCARATMKQKTGCYTMPQVPPMDYIPGNIDDLILSLI
ncbi:MAG: diaminopimelate dehydrogenase [Paludibacteraceae bacterium]|jgi:diaminopimelate dehydrogenase|nr:diaminopimelate dehydrogenase [Paludibacteraceae bacterium]MDD6357125.1 diaminopimelate dehydrogenase [Bacteroidales bacterium]